MTIDFLDADLKGVFEDGMTYVALSRGVAIDHMKIRNFTIRGVRTNPKYSLLFYLINRVIQFYREAETAPEVNV